MTSLPRWTRKSSDDLPDCPFEGSSGRAEKLVQQLSFPNFGVDVARDKYDAIKKSVELLKSSPRTGKSIPELIETGFEHYRQMIIADLKKIIYQIDDEKYIVYAHIICSTRRDFETILRMRLLG